MHHLTTGYRRAEPIYDTSVHFPKQSYSPKQLHTGGDPQSRGTDAGPQCRKRHGEKPLKLLSLDTHLGTWVLVMKIFTWQQYCCMTMTAHLPGTEEFKGLKI